MAHGQDKAVIVSELDNYLKGVAKHFIERVYGPDGMPWGTRFGDLEDIAVELGQIVSRNMIEQAVARQAGSVPADAEVCSGCGQPVTPTNQTEPRAVSSQVGTARWEEPKRYCPKCRAAFFPSVPGVGD